MPLIEDRSRPSSMAVASRCTTAPTAAVPAIGGTGRSGEALGHQRLHQSGNKNRTRLCRGHRHRRSRSAPSRARPRRQPGRELVRNWQRKTHREEPLLAVTMFASMGMTISPEGTTNSASATSDSRRALASHRRSTIPARGEPLTSMRMNSFTDGNRIEPSWRVTLVPEMPLLTKSLASPA